MNNLNNIESNNKIEIIDKYNSLIEKTKWKLFSGLWYEQEWELFYNKAYFNKWQEITQEYINKQIEDGNKVIKELIELNNQLTEESILNDAQKKLISNLINRTILSMRYHQNSIYIEAEKWGYKLSNNDRIHHRNEITKIEQELYWNDITKLDSRKNQVINKLHELYSKNKEILTKEEQKLRQEMIIENFPNTNNIEEKKNDIKENQKDIYIDEKHIFDMVSLLLEIEWFKKEDIIKIQIDTIKKDPEEINWIYYIPAERKDKELYDYFDNKWIWQKFKVIKRTLWNNSIDISKENNLFKKNQINIAPPEKNNKYNITKKILPIIYDHEISTHINTWIWNFNNIYIKDPERSDLEEWIALFNQKMTVNKDIQELYETSIWDIWMFFWENFDEKDTRQLLEIYFKLTKDKTQKIDDRTRRIKMWVPIWEKWARRKDLTYWNGKDIIKDFEELTKTPEWIEILNKYAKAIYSTGLWYDAIKNIDNVLDWIKELDKLEPNFPIFAGKIIYWKLFKGKLDKEKMLENDLRRFIQTNKTVTNEQKRLLIRIIQLIKENWEEAHP